MQKTHIPIDRSMQKHLSGIKKIDTTGFTNVKAVRVDRVEKFEADGFEVIKEQENSDLVLMGKRLPPPSQEKDDQLE